MAPKTHNENNPNETIRQQERIRVQTNQLTAGLSACATAYSRKRKDRKIRRNRMLARDNAAGALLANILEARNLRGGIYPRSLARLEKRGLIRSVGGLADRKLCATADMQSLVENIRLWNPAGEEVSK